MIYYLVLPIFSLLLIALQITCLDLLFMGKIRFEISLILVVYAGFHLDGIKGGVLSFMLGFILDCVASVTPGLFIIIYLSIFIISKVASYLIFAEGMIFIMGFTAFCVLFEGTVIVIINELQHGVNMFNEILNTYFPQALVFGVISPVCFLLFSKFKGFLNVEETR